MDIAHRTSDQVRIPAVGEGEAVIVTRHGREVAAIVTIEDFRLLERVKAAVVASARPAHRPSAEGLEAWATDSEETPTPDELDSIGRGE